jgi:hypothetical protein
MRSRMPCNLKFPKHQVPSEPFARASAASANAPWLRSFEQPGPAQTLSLYSLGPRTRADDFSVPRTACRAGIAAASPLGLVCRAALQACASAIGEDGGVERLNQAAISGQSTCATGCEVVATSLAHLGIRDTKVGRFVWLCGWLAGCAGQRGARLKACRLCRPHRFDQAAVCL